MSEAIPSLQVAEQAIAGIAEMVRELNELRAEKSQAVEWYVKWRRESDKAAYLESALHSAENDKDKALSAFNELDGKWESIPWSTLNHCLLILRQYNRLIQSDDVENRLDEAWTWLTASTPKTEATE